MKQIFLLSILFFCLNCGNKNSSSSSNSPIVGTWSGCVTQSALFNAPIISASFNFTFDNLGGFVGSYGYYGTPDCNGGPGVHVDELIGTYKIGGASSQVPGATEIDIEITSCILAGSICDGNNWNTGNTVYEVFIVNSNSLVLGKCLRDSTCTSPSGRPTVLLTPLSKIQTY